MFGPDLVDEAEACTSYSKQPKSREVVSRELCKQDASTITV
jgi:hypothetical protein